jgi:signal transduction histidine kinase
LVEPTWEAVDAAGMQALCVALAGVRTEVSMESDSSPQIAPNTLADALVALLQLDFAFVRLRRPDGGTVDVARGDAWKAFPEWLERHSATAQFPHRAIIADVGDASEPCRGIAVPIGVDGHGGLVAAARTRSDFPTAVDQLVLSLAADHAATAFHNVRPIEQRASAEEALRQTRNELEAKVAELVATAVANAQAREDLQRLADQQTALRRVATLVVEGTAEADVFALAAREVSRVFGVERVTIDRYDSDAHSTVVASVDDPGFPVGSRWPLDGPSLGATVLETGRAARIEDYTDLHSTSAAAMRAWSIISAVGVPILVDGRPWGVICVANVGETPLPQGIEEALSDFSELLATAIARAEAREALARLADEQAALRRVATLVAEEGSPGQVFAKVAEEAGNVLGNVDCGLFRDEGDGTATVVAACGAVISASFPASARLPIDDDDGVVASVIRKGRPARIDDYSTASGEVAEGARERGIGSAVGCPIVVGGGVWGALVAVTSGEGVWPPEPEQHLAQFADLVATAIANAESKSELAASRRRIVDASDDARRRIERDLHDGTQQRLVSLALAVRAAQSSVPSDLSDLRSQLSLIATGLAGAVEELQELSRGIHPAILAQGGLAPALRTLARRSAVPVALDVRVDTRLPAPIEVAAYYVMSEALANAAKHAQASRIDISVTPRHGRLMLSIRDDGIGGADPSRGSGLVGLTDRIEALGGSISIESPPGTGTRITAELPLEPEVMQER